MEIKLFKNSPVNLSFFKENLGSLKEVQLVNPSATFPVEEDYWMNFFDSGYRVDSLLFKMDDINIGHVALKQSDKKDPKVYLCFVLIPKSFRGKGLSKDILKLTEKFLRDEYNVSEYYLHVLLQNEIAINLYRKVGFEEVSRNEDRIRMRKILK